LSAEQARGEIETVVRQVLDSLGGEKPSPLWAGDVGAFFQIRSLAPSSEWRVKSASTRVELLEVQSVEGDRATVRLKAGVYPTLEHPILGVRHPNLRVTGPAELRRSTDGWKMHTLRVDGTDIATSLFTPFPAVATVGGLRITAIARALARNDELTVTVRNEGRAAAVLDAVFTARRVWLLFEDGSFLLRRRRTLEPGAVWARSAAVKGHLTHAPTRIRIRAEGQDASLALRPPQRSIRRRLDQLKREDVILHLLVAAGAIAWLAGLSPLILGIFLLAAGLVLVLGECLSVVRGVRVSAQLFYATVGAVELTLALGIFKHENAGIITPGLVAATIVAAHVQRFQVELRRRAHD
jgi:hypothetical protein